MKKFFALLAVVLGITGLTAVHSSAQESVNAGNKICPVSGEGFSHGEPATVEHNGKVYNLCCAMCKKDFLKDPEAAIKKLQELEPAEVK